MAEKDSEKRAPSKLDEVLDRIIPLELTISDEYAVAINDMINEFQKFKRSTK